MRKWFLASWDPIDNPWVLLSSMLLTLPGVANNQCAMMGSSNKSSWQNLFVILDNKIWHLWSITWCRTMLCCSPSNRSNWHCGTTLFLPPLSAFRLWKFRGFWLVFISAGENWTWVGIWREQWEGMAQTRWLLRVPSNPSHSMDLSNGKGIRNYHWTCCLNHVSQVFYVPAEREGW